MNAQTCEPSSQSHGNSLGLKKYTINYGTLANYGLTQAEGLGSTILGADSWNEHGNTGYFQFVGTNSKTLNTYSGLSSSQCLANGLKESLVVFTDECGPPGQTFAVCGGDQFVIVIRRFFALPNGTCGPEVVYGNGAVSGLRDLPGILTHEFGHVTGVGHHDVVGVMDNENMMTSLDRQLYEADFKCTVDVAGGYRNLSEYKRFQNSSGAFGTATLVGTGRTKAHAGFTDAFTWASSAHRGIQKINWNKNADGTSVTLSNPGTYNGTGFVPGLWRDTPGVDRVFYSYWQESPQFSLTGIHRVRQIRSENEFGTQSANWLSNCNSMTGWLTCSSTSILQSPGRVSTAFWDGGNRAVVAWIHHDRTNNNSSAASNEIRIAVGNVHNDTVAQPTLTGIRSAVAPGISCRNNFSSNYDCVILYVPIEDLAARIVARRFSIVAGATHYLLNFDPNIYYFSGSAKSGGPVAVWWNDGMSRFYAAWRDAQPNQTIAVRYSSDGTSWTHVSSNIDTSYIAPTAANMFLGQNNILIYAK